MRFGYWGGHWVRWFWLAWILRLCVVAAIVFVIVRVVPGRFQNRPSPSPLEILQRRYAAGEISTAEYEERKARLEVRT
jgi:putative membrane protein